MTLANRTILVTRPAHQAKTLCYRLRDKGAKAILFPTLGIESTSQPDQLKRAIARLAQCEIVIFLSANAVHRALPLWPEKKPSATIIAIGPGTHRALQQYGLSTNAMPEQYSSEGLLELPLLKTIKGQSITVFSGENPRPLLTETLTERGATITEAFCYRRTCPHYSQREIEEQCAQTIDVILSTSSESLQNLCKLFSSEKQRSWLHATRLLVISPKMADFARREGFIHEPIIAENPRNETLIKTLTLSLA